MRFAVDTAQPSSHRDRHRTTFTVETMCWDAGVSNSGRHFVSPTDIRTHPLVDQMRFDRDPDGAVTSNVKFDDLEHRVAFPLRFSFF